MKKKSSRTRSASTGVALDRAGSAPSSLALISVVQPRAMPPLVARVSIEANRGTPALASMIARILLEAGATVSFGDDRAEMPQNVCNLIGLHVHIDRLTWVRDEETDRWPRGQNKPTDQ